MKRLLIIAYIGLLVTGCNSSKIIKETQICSMGTYEYRMEAENDIIKKLTIGVEIPSYLFYNPDSIFNLTDTDKEVIGNLVLSQLGLKKSEGINIDFNIKEKKLIPTVTFEFDKVDDSILKNIGLSKETKLSVANFKMNGAYCR